MRRTHLLFTLTGLLALGGFLVRQVEVGKRLAVAEASLVRQNQKLAQLRRERDRLAKLQISDEELAQIRAAAAEAARLRAGNLQVAAQLKLLQSETAGKPTRRPPTIAMVSAKDWKNAGRSSPRAAFETALWAAAGGDTDHLAETLDFSPEARSKADALFAGLSDNDRAQYGTPEKLVALMVAKDIPLGAMQVFAQTEQDPNNATLFTVLEDPEGNARQTNILLHQSSGGWQLVVPPDAVDKYTADLAAPALAAPAAKP